DPNPRVALRADPAEGLAVEAEMVEDFAHDAGVGEEGDELKLALAVRTDEHAELEHALHQLGPGAARRSAGLARGRGRTGGQGHGFDDGDRSRYPSGSNSGFALRGPF